LKKLTRRQFFRLGTCSLIAGAFLDMMVIEPRWMTVKEVNLSEEPTHRIVHFSDLHYKGDDDFLLKVMNRMNSLSPDFACFTGDLIEKERHLEGALRLLNTLRCPLYGVPGNHDYWSGAPFSKFAAGFRATGGDWLVNRSATSADGNVHIIGADNYQTDFSDDGGSLKKLLLVHYPDYVDRVRDRTYDLILAGHSHGGQIRIPFWGAAIVPFGVGQYEKGLYRTGAGPLYVNPGIGWYYFRARFFCRPEITVIRF
jgi:predicted MPP superfamily phosphohydrolase